MSFRKLGSLSLVAVLFLAGCDSDRPSDQARPTPADPSSKPELASVDKCDEVSFRPGAPGLKGMDARPQLEASSDSLTSSRGVYRWGARQIQVFSGTPPWAPPYRQTPARTRQINVLRRPASIGLIHEGYSVEFDFRGCHYALLAYGLDRWQLRVFAEYLVPTECTLDARLRVHPERAPGGSRVTLRGSCFFGAWARLIDDSGRWIGLLGEIDDTGHATFRDSTRRHPHTCELIAFGRGTYRINRNGSLHGSFTVPEEGGCNQQGESHEVVPGPYRVFLDCHTCDFGVFRVTN